MAKKGEESDETVRGHWRRNNSEKRRKKELPFQCSDNSWKAVITLSIKSLIYTPIKC